MNFDYFNWIILPLLIFVSRLADVSLATLRHIFVSKGYKTLVPILGFFEVLIWLVAIRQIFNNVDNIACYLAWAGGFSAGTYLGMYLEEKMALGMQIIRVITNDDTDKLVEAFRKCQQGITVVNGQGAMGPVKIIFTVVKRTNKSEIIKLIEEYSPNAFYSVEEVKKFEHGVFRNSKETSVIKRMLSLSK
ncbi:MAG: DUF2179 domain-containing protein [Sphingobacteriaceae bacterium]|nr:DUF2179 domain-containing protein [Sphingobacteriaceae bacterium]